tara:strand:+ start:2419 stop:3060 length:642 start_codon:yes stop_codon:yes gene_type:complete
MKIAILDFALGNIYNVQRALELFCDSVYITKSPIDALAADALVIPGVGAFRDGIKNLNSSGLISTIEQFVDSNKPILGICLGMQLFMERSFEFGEHKGLGFIKGDVLPFPAPESTENHYKVPHVGWSEIEPQTSHELLQDIDKPICQYFVHSFCCHPVNAKNIVGKTTHGRTTFTSIMSHENIMGIQFHPERGGPQGLKILKNFYELILKKNS